jgi:hypothetical protein
VRGQDNICHNPSRHETFFRLPATDKLDKVRAYTGDHKCILGTRFTSNGRGTASTKVEEEQDLATHRVSGAAVDHWLEAARSRAKTHGLPDFNPRIVVGRDAGCVFASWLAQDKALALRQFLKLRSLRCAQNLSPSGLVQSRSQCTPLHEGHSEGSGSPELTVSATEVANNNDERQRPCSGPDRVCSPRWVVLTSW